MSTLNKLGWSMQLATTSAKLHHSDTHTLIRRSLMHGRYYVTEHDLSCLLLRNTCESKEAANTAHTEEIENMDYVDQIPPPLVDVAYDKAEGRGNPLLATTLEVWNTGGHHSDFLTRELPKHRKVKAQAAITRNFDSLQLNTENITHVAIDHLLHLAEQNEEIQETVAPTREASLTKTYFRPIRHSRYAEYEYLLKKEK